MKRRGFLGALAGLFAGGAYAGPQEALDVGGMIERNPIRPAPPVPVTIQIEGGGLDLSDPRQVEALARAIHETSGDPVNLSVGKTPYTRATVVAEDGTSITFE